jgi:hypothetical protein
MVPLKTVTTGLLCQEQYYPNDYEHDAEDAQADE